MELEIFKLQDHGVCVNVKPCRRCFEKFQKKVKPEFQVFSDEKNGITMYRVRCPECNNRHEYSEMWSDSVPGEVERRYNDWDKPLEDWIKDLNW